MPRTLAQNAQYIAETIKPAIKSAIEAQGVTVPSTDSFLDYADRIGEIEGGGGGGGGSAIDTSKVDYEIGNGNIGLYDGRYLKGFRDVAGYCAYPVVGESNAAIDVDWSDSFEIGVRFKLTDYLSSNAFQFLFGCGLNGTAYRFYTPSMFVYGGDYKLAVQCGATSSSWLVTETLDYVVSLDTWYFVKLKFVKSTMKFTVDVTTDFETYTNLYTTTLASAPYYNSSANLAIGGDCRQSDRTTNTCLIDTLNTYVKDATGSIAWGCFEGQGAEYELWDYIQSDGTQVIDLGFAPENGATVTTSFVLLSTQTSEAFVYGATDNSAWLGFAQNPASRNTIYENNTSGRSESYIQNQQYLLTLTASRDYTNHLCMFGFYLNGYAPGIKTRLCYCKYNDNFYLPAKRKSDGVFGLYDVTNQTFLTDSAGGNAFVGGNPTGVEV